MSGPIIRKYGFPNFENIFGKRDLEHGTEEAAPKADAPGQASPKGGKTATPTAPEATKPTEKR